MHIPKNNPAKGDATNSLLRLLSLGSMAAGLLVGVLQDCFHRFKPFKRWEAAGGKASKPSALTLYEKT